MPENEYIYFEGDTVEGIFFIKQGSVSYVMPKHSNTKYLEIDGGHHFGTVDIVSSILQFDHFTFDDWISSNEKMKRNFTVMAS